MLDSFVAPQKRTKHTKLNLLLAATTTYTVLDLLSVYVPGPLSPLPVDDYVRLLSRIATLFGA